MATATIELNEPIPVEPIKTVVLEMSMAEAECLKALIQGHTAGNSHEGLYRHIWEVARALGVLRLSYRTLSVEVWPTNPVLQINN